MSGAKPETSGGVGRHLSPFAAWGLSFGYAVGWGAFVMPGAAFPSASDISPRAPRSRSDAIEVMLDCGSGDVVDYAMSWGHHEEQGKKDKASKRR